MICATNYRQVCALCLLLNCTQQYSKAVDEVNDLFVCMMFVLF